ncbi:hypothetical protein CNR22_18380 [Sphingobacteriaceae bacterium]|nr:hypothetical protein CNR22_18380 [Sphingobacteriaceae bacterium]
MNNAPEKFLSLYMPAVAANAIDSLTSTDGGAKAMEKLLNVLGGDSGKRYACFLHVGKRAGQMDVFRDLLQQYPDASMKITALTLFMEELGVERSVSGYEGQLEEIINVKRRYPERLLIFLSVDPRWKTSGQELLTTVKTYFDTQIKVAESQPAINAFTGLKLYPSTGFYAFDEKLKPTFEWAAQNNVPILTHCSYLGGIFNNNRDYLNASLRAWNPYLQSYHAAPKPGHKLESKFFRRLINTQKLGNNQNYCSYFLEPESYRAMLQYFKDQGTPLKLCFAHFGGSEHMMLQNTINNGGKNAADDYYGVNNTVNWTAQIQQLMLDFDSVYTDVSYSLTDHKTHDFIFSELKKPYGDRILFGTDFFMTERVAKEKDTFAIFRRKALEYSLVSKQGVASNAWDIMASANVEKYLNSKYYL